MEFNYHQQQQFDHFAASSSYGCYAEYGEYSYHHHHHQPAHQPPAAAAEIQPIQFVCHENNLQFKQSLSNEYETYQSIPSLSPQSQSLSYTDSYYYPSSAEHSPYNESEESNSPFGQIDNLDSILNEIANAENIDDILLAKNEDDLYNLLETSEHECDSQIISVNSETSPKRKLSIDSSGYSSFEYDSETLSPSITTITTATTATSTETKEKKRRNRRCKHTKEERALRKKDQNKKAAIKYREKKKVETETIEQIVEQLEHKRDGLSIQFRKIETEFNVILPLAKAAFQMDPIRAPKLQQLLARLQQNGFTIN